MRHHAAMIGRSRPALLGSVLGVALAALACFACKSGSNGAGTPPVADGTPPASEDPVEPPPAGLDPKDPMFACTAAADCVVVEMGCCDHCNGGWQLTVSTAHVDAANAKYHAQDCSGACTKRGCEWAETPVCEAGSCARTEDRDGDPSTPPTLVPNALPTE